MSTKSNWKFNLLAIAAAVTATAATASAQQVTVEATVPFAFSVNSARLAPGTYNVSRKGDIWWFRSANVHQVAAITGYTRIPGESNEQPRLTFNCLRGNCQLSAVHMGGGSRGIQVYGHKLSKSDQNEIARVNVPLQSHKTEMASR